jgi:hypothetical protein
MPISIPSEDQVAAICIAYFAAKPKLKGAPLSESSLLGGMARSLAQTISAVLQAVQDCDYDSLPQVIYQGGTPTTPTSSTALDNWAVTLGLPSNRGAGVYGRNGQSGAIGGTVTPSGSAGVIVPPGTQLIDVATNSVTLQVTDGFTLPVSSSIAVNAVTLGSVGNLQAGALLRWVSPPTGLASTVTLGKSLSGGAELESDVALALRILARLQNPPKAGTPSDWRNWAQSATDSSGVSLNIARAYVYPLRDGSGSVTIVPLLAGSGQGRDPGNPDTTIPGKVQTYLNSLRIATDTVYVVRPYFPGGSGLSIVVRCRPAVGYVYDWDDSSVGGTSVASYGANYIVISTLTPTNLVSAMGNTPRIQLQITGQTLPWIGRVTNYTDNSPIGGQATLTLDSTPPGTPTLMYAGGPAVLPVATAILGYVDSLGPSLQSGYADPGDSWSDTCSVGGIADAALDAVGSDGRRCLTLAPNVGNDSSASIGVAITVGGTTAAADIQAQDFWPTFGPQLLTAASILVIKG